MSEKKELRKMIKKAKKQDTTVTKLSKAMLDLGYVIKDYKLNLDCVINDEPTIELKLHRLKF